jgi:hypothetical protein
MSSGNTALEQPQILASLPRPVDRVEAQTKAAVVWSGVSCRKRPEVVVAVDGEGINIYNVCDLEFEKDV